ncbi:M56 family metallopeptidase [Pedobacter sp. ASV12]|uniref:M56 family metallopeptidase n=1 Tax=Pedobacter sp. ASV12 TaxID=2795120 RepID=UPI001E487FFA|nr:M56 family metallopeptidase [Pedobacter sp. ASV12]
MINNLVKAIGWSILHSLWQGAIIYAFLFAVLMIWPKISARIKHNLAFGSLFLIFASFCFTFGSIFQWPSTGSAINSIVITPAIYQRLTGMANSFNAKTEAYFPIVVVVYIIGILFQLVVLSSSYAKLKKLKQAHVDAIPAHWKAIFELTLAQLKIKKRVQFYLSSRVNVPVVIGFFKPVVLFPIALATQLDTKQVEAILIHELSHIRRNDYLINLAKTFIETLLFFNPFVWLTTKFIHIEREHACDDLVVNFTGSPITYAHALLKLELLKDKQSPALALAATGNNQHLYQRIKRITAMKTNYINAKQQFFILTLAIATVISLAWMNPSKSVAAKLKKAPNLLTVKIVPSEGNPIKNHLIVVSDTDTAKSKKKIERIWYTTNQSGKEITYRSIDEMPDSIKAKYLELQKKFSSKEWKDKMAKIEFDSKELEKKFNSKEWKDKMAKIEQNSKELEKKFNSPEWKEKMEEYRKLQESPEYKELRKKYESDLEELKKKKGIKTDKTFLMFDNSHTVDLSFLPNTKAFDTYFAFANTTPVVFNKNNTFKFEAAPATFKEAFKTTFKMEGDAKFNIKIDNK